jgi:hypothetical protein
VKGQENMNGKGYQMVYKGAAGKAFSALLSAYVG